VNIKSWDTTLLSQFPVVVKRNDRYYLILGIRYGETSQKQEYIWEKRDNWKFWDSFPFFTSTGMMAVETPDTENELKRLYDFKRPRTAYPAYSEWSFNNSGSNGYGLVLDERCISRQERDLIMNGLDSVIHQVLVHNPLQILNKVCITMIDFNNY
jgi:hypothetical protein